MTVTERRAKVGLQLTKPQGNLKAHKNWLDFLTGSEFYPLIKKRFESKTRISKVRTSTRSIVRQEVYQPYSPRKYQRTFNLLNSYLAEGGSGKTAEIIVYSDVRTAPAKSGASAGKFSYAAFFEEQFQKPPEDGGTFIPQTALPFRPNFQLIVMFVNDFLTEGARVSVESAIRFKMPRTNNA